MNLKRKVSNIRFTLGVSTFIPKAHTPFQWNGVKNKAKKRLKTLEKYLKPNGIDFRPESYNWSIIQALISRSDRRLAPVIASMRKSHSSLGNWKKAYRAVQEENESNKENLPIPLPPLPDWKQVIHENWDTSQVLPWSHIKGPLKPEILVEHHQQALHEVV